MKAVVLKKYGSADSLEVSEIPEPEISSEELKVKIKYAGINFADILSRKGIYSWAPKNPYVMGLEAAGEVVEVGKNVDGVEVGQRVIIGDRMGAYAEYKSVHKDLFLPAPEYLSWEECAAFGVNFFTAWMSMHEVARVRRGERMLVHAAAGGVGTAALMLGKANGMEMYGTSSVGKKEIVENLGAEHLSYEKFDKELMDRRPDFVLETIGGEVFRRSFRILAPLGRLISVGAMSLSYNKYNPFSVINALRNLPKVSIRDVLRKSKSYMGIHVGYLLTQPQILRPSWAAMLKVCEEYDLHPIVEKDAIFPMSDVSKAHRYIEDRKNIGKVLLDPSR